MVQIEFTSNEEQFYPLCHWFSSNLWNDIMNFDLNSTCYYYVDIFECIRTEMYPLDALQVLEYHVWTCTQLKGHLFLDDLFA